ncbi:MAG: hypothetical protein H0U10_08985 [Chloroflexia bacterium]|nr:hypothetical protein [Chloroflexia bacterium]
MNLSALLTLVRNLIAAFGGSRSSASSPHALPLADARCGLEPRPIAEVVALGGHSAPPPAPTLGGPFFPIELAPAGPVDPVTAAAVVAAAAALADCFAGAEPARGLSGLTDGYLGRIVDHDGAEGVETALSLVASSARRPVQPESFAPVGVVDLGQLDPGRVAIGRSLSWTFPEQGAPKAAVGVAFVFVASGGYWLLDDFGFVGDTSPRSEGS